MLPGAHDVEFAFGQVSRVFIDKRMKKIDVLEEGIPDLEANPRRQCDELFVAVKLVRDHLETLVYKRHQRSTQLEEQDDIRGS
jgi:hypothetical protein